MHTENRNVQTVVDSSLGPVHSELGLENQCECELFNTLLLTRNMSGENKYTYILVMLSGLSRVTVSR